MRHPATVLALGNRTKPLHGSDMSAPKNPVPPPLAGDVHPGRRFSLCGEALAPSLAALQAQAEAAGWHPREIAMAVMTWAVT